MSKRFVIDWQITGKCNMSCQFCCGALKNQTGPSYAECKEIIDKLASLGCTTIVLTGGEPLIRSDIVDVIKYAYRSGLEVYLSTNGIYLSDIYSQIRDYISCLGLPLDGSDAKMNSLMTRSPKLFESTKKALCFFKDNPPSHQIKIGTVISSVNKDDIDKIAKFLFVDNDFKVDVWRLYQFSPLREGKFNKDKFRIDDEEYKSICLKLMLTYPGRQIIPLSDADSSDSYMFINPRAELEVLTDNEFKIIGNVLALSVDELKLKVSKNISVVRKGEENRLWLIENGIKR